MAVKRYTCRFEIMGQKSYRIFAASNKTKAFMVFRDWCRKHKAVPKSMNEVGNSDGVWMVPKKYHTGGANVN